MRRGWWLLATNVVLLATACGTLLGYDELTERESAFDTGTTPVSDGADSADVVEEVEPVDAKDAPVRPPPRPAGALTPSGKGRTLWLLVRRQYLDTQSLGSVPAPDGGATPTSKTAWREFGYDIDGVCTGAAESADSTGTCKRSTSSKEDVLVDGDSCRDNNFGSQLVPVISAFNTVFEDETNFAILDGNNTWIIRIDDLDDGEDDPYAPGALYKSADCCHLGLARPKMDGSDVYDVEADSVIGGDLKSPRANFTKGYLSKNVWVSGEGATFDVVTPFDTTTTVMPLVGGVVTVRLSSDHKTAGLGTLAGAIPLSQIEQLVRPIAAATGFCADSPLYKALLAQIATFPDVVAGAPGLLDRSKPCDAMSIGLAFELVPVQPVPAVVPASRFPSKCDDAGVDSGGGG